METLSTITLAIVVLSVVFAWSIVAALLVGIWYMLKKTDPTRKD